MASVVSTRPRGVVTPLVTPLAKDETLDRDALRRLVERQVEAGVDGLFVLGSVGEGPLLPEEVRRAVIRETLDVVAGAVPVYAGAMENSTTLVLKRLGAAAQAGAKAGAVTLPYYGWPDHSDAATAFFLALADQSPLPIIVYNLPKVSLVSLTTACVQALYGHHNIIGMKDTRADFEAMKALASDPAREGRMTYLPGNSVLAAQLLASGADGFVSVLSNLAPELLVAMYGAHTAGEAERRDALSDVIAGLGRILTHPTAPGGIKCALEMLGYGTRRTVHPWPCAGSSDCAAVANLLKDAGVRMAELGMSSGVT